MQFAWNIPRILHQANCLLQRIKLHNQSSCVGYSKPSQKLSSPMVKSEQASSCLSLNINAKDLQLGWNTPTILHQTVHCIVTCSRKALTGKNVDNLFCQHSFNHDSPTPWYEPIKQPRRERINKDLTPRFRDTIWRMSTSVSPVSRAFFKEHNLSRESSKTMIREWTTLCNTPCCRSTTTVTMRTVPRSRSARLDWHKTTLFVSLNGKRSALYSWNRLQNRAIHEQYTTNEECGLVSVQSNKQRHCMLFSLKNTKRVEL